MGPGSRASFKKQESSEFENSDHDVQPSNKKIKIEEFDDISENPYEQSASPVHDREFDGSKRNSFNAAMQGPGGSMFTI